MKKDKVYHLIAGVVISALSGLFIYVGWAFILGALAGILKEVYDKYIKRTYFDVYDMLYTWLGAFIGSVVIGIIKNLWN